jgi:hypothetical protein
MYTIQNVEDILDKICDLHTEKEREFTPIWEAWDRAKKELNEIGYAMDKLFEARETGVVNSKTLKTIEKYFPENK